MDFTYTPEQLMLADSVARYLAQQRDFHARQAMLADGATWSKDVWGHFARQGLLGLARSEDHGGLGGTVVDVVAVAERFGAALVAEPYLSTAVLAGGVLAAAASNDTARALLAQTISGDAVVALAHDEGVGGAPACDVQTSAVRAGDTVEITGEKALVLDGGDADRLVVSARLDGELALLLVDPAARGVRREPFRTLDGRGAARLRLDGVRVDGSALLDAAAAAVVETVVGDAILYLAAETVGAMDALLRTTATYASTRRQFGVPIGSFQVIAHRIADMKIALLTSRASLSYVAAQREAGRATAHDLAVLKAQSGRLGRAVGEAAVQIHGGVGMTDELPVGHYLKRIIANDVLFGAADVHLRRLGQPSADRGD